MGRATAGRQGVWVGSKGLARLTVACNEARGARVTRNHLTLAPRSDRVLTRTYVQPAATAARASRASVPSLSP